MLIMFISMNICLLKMYMTGSMFIKFGKCTKSVPLPNCDEMHHLLTCYASPQVKTGICPLLLARAKRVCATFCARVFKPLKSCGISECLNRCRVPTTRLAEGSVVGLMVFYTYKIQGNCQKI